MGHARHLAETGDDEMDSVQGNEVEAVRTPQVETPEHTRAHEDLLREGPQDAGAAEGIGEAGVDITQSDGPYLQGGDDVS